MKIGEVTPPKRPSILGPLELGEPIDHSGTPPPPGHLWGDFRPPPQIPTPPTPPRGWQPGQMNSRTPLRWVSSHPAFVAAARFATNPPSAKTATPQQKIPTPPFLPPLNGKSYDAKVIGTDEKTDLALIKVDGNNFPYVKFADHAPRVGDWVVAVGNPFGLGGTVTAGLNSRTPLRWVSSHPAFVAAARFATNPPSAKTATPQQKIPTPPFLPPLNGKSYDAKVIGTDEKTDLALIKVDGNNFPYVKFADHAPRVGDWVVAVGNPFGLGGTVTAGIVSARGRDIGAGPYDDFIQIDAPINKGNSGGPAFDIDGNVIGVNTAIFSPSGGSVGVGFDIPADTAKSVVAQLKDKGHVVRGWLGVQIQPVTADIADSLGMKTVEGALVAEPQLDSPAGVNKTASVE